MHFRKNSRRNLTKVPPCFLHCDSTPRLAINRGAFLHNPTVGDKFKLIDSFNSHHQFAAVEGSA
jgi:hypothetical protein